MTGSYGERPQRQRSDLVNAVNVGRGFRRTIFALACFAFAAGYGYFAIRGYRAFALSGAADQTSLQRSIRAEPRNASGYNAYCRYLRDQTVDFAAALPYCRRAVELNPNDSANWLDLAEVLYVTGDGVAEKLALEKAVAADPTTPEVAWNAGNLYLLQGDVPTALSLFKTVLKSDPALVPFALKTLWRTLGSVTPIIEMMPPNPTAYVNFIGLLASENEREAAAQVWQKLIDLDQPIDYRGALFYVDDLLAWKNVTAAKEAWKQLGERNELFHSYQPKANNMVVNSSFEDELLNSGFDWHLSSQATKVTVDDETFRSGGHAALITYSTPVLDSGLYQLVPVKPNSAYKATAWLKTEELQTANGPRLALTDAYTGALLGASEPVAYTTPWKQVTVDFSTGPQTELVVIRLDRERQDTVVRGRLWMDDADMQPLTANIASQ